jgi:flavin reductase (DIM6/NTAB) family NADH-FMN oxidoreductase RutF
MSRYPLADARCGQVVDERLAIFSHWHTRPVIDRLPAFRGRARGSDPMSQSMNKNPMADCANALGQIPGGLFILTSQFDGRSGGVPVRWVQQCSSAPPMITVALYKGQAVEMLIRDSHFFTLCQVSADDRFLLCKFNGQHHNGDDALLALMTRAAPSGCPIIDRALSYLDCEVVRHVELDCDYRIYVGQVHAGGMLHQGTPAVRFGAPTPALGNTPSNAPTSGSTPETGLNGTST